jgi:hypothetical protein
VSIYLSFFFLHHTNLQSPTAQIRIATTPARTLNTAAFAFSSGAALLVLVALGEEEVDEVEAAGRIAGDVEGAVVVAAIDVVVVLKGLGVVKVCAFKVAFVMSETNAVVTVL